MAESKELVPPDLLTYQNYNDLRKDVLDPTAGHSHLGGTDQGKKLGGAFIGDDVDFGGYRIKNFEFEIAGPGDWEIVQPVTVEVTETTATKKAEFLIVRDGTFRTRLGLKATYGYTVYGQIYRNGNPYGTLRSTTSDVWTYWEEDLWFTKPDLCQIYLYVNGGTGWGSLVLRVSNPIEFHAARTF